MVYAVGLGVVNSQRADTGCARVGPYPPRTVCADAPPSYYEEPLRSRHHALVAREGSDKDGHVDFDEPGRQVGSWFRADMPPGSEGSLDRREMWSRHLHFLVDNEYPSNTAVSIGGTLSTGARVYFLDATAPDPRSVAPASGLVAYRLQPRLPAPFSPQAAGTLLVRRVSADTLEVEAFPSDTTARAFTSAAVRYTRCAWVGGGRAPRPNASAPSRPLFTARPASRCEPSPNVTYCAAGG